jgi:ankyrin repeat protein
MINKAINYNIKNNNYDKFIVNLKLRNTNIDIPNHKGITLVMQCIINKCEDIYLDELITRSNSNYINKFGETPIHFSILFDNFSAFKKLIKAGYFLSKYNNKTLIEIVERSNIKQKSKYLIILRSMRPLK